MPSVKPSSPVDTNQGTKRHIKDAYNIIYGKVKGFVHTRDLSHRVPTLIERMLNICFTGIIIQYIITNRNFLSYGLASALIMFYVVWLRRVFVAKKQTELDKIW